VYDWHQCVPLQGLDRALPCIRSVLPFELALLRDVCSDCLRPHGCVNKRHLPVRRALSGWPTLFHLGRDAWCLRFSVADLHRYGLLADVTAHRLSFRPTSPFVGAGCRSPPARLHCCVRTMYDMPSWGSFPLRCINAEVNRDLAISSQRLPVRCAVRMSRLPRPLRSCGTFRVRRLPARPLRALPRHLPGLFHPGGIHGVLPFRGLTSHWAGHLSASPALLFLGWSHLRATLGFAPSPLCSRFWHSNRRWFGRFAGLHTGCARISSVPRWPRLLQRPLSKTPAAWHGSMRCSFAGCQALRVAPVESAIPRKVSHSHASDDGWAQACFDPCSVAAIRFGFASSSRISLACGIGFRFARHGRLLVRTTALLVTDTDVLAWSTISLGFSASRIHPPGFTPLPLSMLPVCSMLCRHSFDRPSACWNSRV